VSDAHFGPVLKAELRYVDDVVEQPHSDLHGVRKALKIDTGFCGRDHRPRTAERDCTAGVCGSDPLAVPRD